MAYCSCVNSKGAVDSSWINFNVVGKAGYSKVSKSAEWYDLKDTISISVDTVCAKGQVIGIDKVGGGRVITSECDSTYQIAASNLGIGEYSAYFSVYNGSGSIDTKRVEFSIVNKNGVYKAEDNNWYYYKNGKKDTSFTGLAKNTYGVWYCKKGKVQFNTTDVLYSKGTLYSGWYYVKKGQLQTGKTTVEKNGSGWWYIGKDGKVDFSFTGIASNAYGSWYLEKGKVSFSKNIKSYTDPHTKLKYRVVRGKATRI